LPAKVAGAGRYSEDVLRAIDHALEFAEKDRPQSLVDWKKELAGSPKPATPTNVAKRDADAPAPAVPSRRGALLWASAGAAAVIVAAATIPLVASIWHQAPQASPEPPPAEKPAPKDEPRDALCQRLEALEKQLAEYRARREEEAKRKAEYDLRIGATLPREQPNPRAPEPKRAQGQGNPKAETKRSQPTPELAPVARLEPANPEPPKPEPKLEPVKPEPPKVEPPKEAPKVEVAKVDPLVAIDRAIAQANYGEAIAALKPLADDNNPRAQVRLGKLYLEGQGVPRNETEASRLFHRAAERGENEARLRLGDMYANGRGVPQSNFQAYVWYWAAARSGNAAAKANQERVGATLQPMEIRQAGKVIESLVAAGKP